MKIRIAQFSPKKLRVSSNLAYIQKQIEIADQNDVDILVLPECCTTGYCLNRNECEESAESVNGDSIKAIQDSIDTASKLHLVFGMLEREDAEIYNSAFAVTSSGILHRYRKVHLPYMGVDRYVKPGKKLDGIFELNGVKIAVNICYDYRFPEAARISMLAGAQVLLLPTNWPDDSRDSVEKLCSARALENRIYVLAVNRCGLEEGVKFLGESIGFNPLGDSIYKLGPKEEAIEIEIDPTVSNDKTNIAFDGASINILSDRVPSAYYRLSR